MLKVGMAVRVKPGVLDPDLGMDIGGWQGRIREVDTERTIFIAWDSVTLRRMGLELIIRCENENLDWRVMTLNRDGVEAVEARDTEDDAEATKCELHDRMRGDPRLVDGW